MLAQPCGTPGTNGRETGMTEMEFAGNPDNTPLVSVYLTTFNRVQLLQTALQSVLDQTYKNIEIIVADDHSTDGTAAFMAEATRKDNRIVYLRNEKNSGACFSRNAAIAKAKGTFITGLDDDDEFTADRIERFVSEYDPGDSFLCSNVIIKRDDGEVVNYDQMVIDEPSILYENYAHNQVFVATDRIRKLGGFDINLTACQDYDMWIRLILAHGPARRISAPTYLVKEDDNIARITASPKAFKGYLRVYKRYKHRMSKRQRVNRLVYVRAVQCKKVSSRIAFFAKHLGVVKTLKFLMKENHTNAFRVVNFFRKLKRRARILSP
jgi:glycosyltransferase involved in cell wall biosynthesis